MSYTGSDDQPLCDGPCNRMCPPGWPDWIMPWPVPGPHLETGRVPSDQCDNFHLCRDCLQELVLLASLRPAERALARRSRARRRASQELLDQAGAVGRGSTA
jgi:hypothetical protein